MKEDIWALIYVILGSLAALIIVGVMISMNKTEHLFETPCEELVRQNDNDKDYVPIPKRCEEGK